MNVYGRLATRAEGLTAAEAEVRLSEHGPNVLARDQRPGFVHLLWRSVINPLVILPARRARDGLVLDRRPASGNHDGAAVEKHAVESMTARAAPLELSTIAYLGTSVESGSASAVVITTGKGTYLGGMAEAMSEQPAATAFDRDISQFTWLLLRFMLVMVPLVFVINGHHER